MDELRSKALTSVWGFNFLVGVLIFLPAWRLTYWQGWLYWVVFSLATLLITSYLLKHDRPLLERRMKAGPAAETEKSQQIIQAVSSILVTALLIVSCLDQRFGWSHVPGVLSVEGSMLVALGFYIVFLVFRKNSYTPATVKIDKEQTVVTTGPYAVVRHPMYSGALLLFLGTPIGLGSYWGLIISVLVTIVLAIRAIDEENLLIRELAGYAAYRSQTKYRLIPGIW